MPPVKINFFPFAIFCDIFFYMETKILQTGSGSSGQEAIKQAAAVIRSGGLAAFPTETVYGLGANAHSPSAAKKIYAAKGRPSDNPLIIHIADLSDLGRAAEEIPRKARLLAEAFWPGPLTLVLKKKKEIPPETTGGLDTAAVRMPDHPAALALIRESGCLIAAPSANASGRPSPTLAVHVAQDLGGKIPVILDGGPTGIGIESTIVDMTQEPPMILRPGFITEQMLEAVIGTVRTDPGILGADFGQKPKAPGMKYRHYAPDADLILVEGAPDAVIGQINAWTAQRHTEQKKVGILASDQTAAAYRADTVLRMGSREDGTDAAKRLYAVLREFDERGVDVIYAECVAAPGIGQAVMNRLLKAAGYRIFTIS